MKNPLLFPRIAARAELAPTPHAKINQPAIPTMRKGSPKIPDALIAHARWAYDHGWPIKAVSVHFGWSYKYTQTILTEGQRQHIQPAKPDWWD